MQHVTSAHASDAGRCCDQRLGRPTTKQGQPGSPAHQLAGLPAAAPVAPAPRASIHVCRIARSIADRFSFPDPLFPFGYGLSFTSWAYSGLSLAPAVVQPCENLTVAVTVKNTGSVAGSEVVQLYASWAGVGGGSPTADLTLVNFDRVHLEPGQEATVTMVVDPRHYAVLQVLWRGLGVVTGGPLSVYDPMTCLPPPSQPTIYNVFGERVCTVGR